MQSLLKPTDVARQLGVSRAWIYDAAKSARIPSVRIGGEEGTLRFVAEDLEHWIDEARDRWRPGRPSAPTRSLRAINNERRSARRSDRSRNGQQSLL